MFGYYHHHYYDEDWGHPPWSYPPPEHWPGVHHGGLHRRRSRYSGRYPVYSRHGPEFYHSQSWLPPGAVQLYGHHGHHRHYLEPEFRSNSANLPVPPPVEYVWSHRPTRRTKSSAHPRQHRHQHHHHPSRSHHPPSPQFYPPEPPPLVHHSSFARRFFNDRETKTEQHHVSRVHLPSHQQHNVLIEPDIHDHSQQHSLVSQLLVNSRPGSSRSSQYSQHHHRSDSQLSHHHHRSNSDRSHNSRHSSQHSRSHSSRDQYRVISDLIPHTTLNILQSSLSAASTHHASCTCYQCSPPPPRSASPPTSKHSSLEHRSKHPLTSLTSDINSNLVTSGECEPYSLLCSPRVESHCLSALQIITFCPSSQKYNQHCNSFIISLFGFNYEFNQC